MASVISFSVLCSLLSVCYIFLILYVTNFLILLQYNIRPPDSNYDVCDPKFALGVNLRRHDTSTQTVMNVMMIFCLELSNEDILGAGPQSQPLPLVSLKIGLGRVVDNNYFIVSPIKNR